MIKRKEWLMLDAETKKRLHKLELIITVIICVFTLLTMFLIQSFDAQFRAYFMVMQMSIVFVSVIYWIIGSIFIVKMSSIEQK